MYDENKENIKYALSIGLVEAIEKIPKSRMLFHDLKRRLHQIADQTQVYDDTPDERLNDEQLKNAEDTRAAFRRRIKSMKAQIEAGRAKTKGIEVDIDAAQEFIEEYLQADYNATMTMLSEFKDWKYEQQVEQMRRFWQKKIDICLRDYAPRKRGVPVIHDKLEQRNATAARKAPRKLFKIEQYTSATYPYLYACYVSANRKKSQRYFYKLYVAKIKYKRKYQAEFIIISRYLESGRQKQRWEWNIGERINKKELKLIAYRTFLEPKNHGQNDPTKDK